MTLNDSEVILIGITLFCVFIAIIIIFCRCKRKMCSSQYLTNQPIITDPVTDPVMDPDIDAVMDPVMDPDIDAVMDPDIDAVVDADIDDELPEQLQRLKHRNSQPQFRGRVGNHGDYCQNGHWCKPMSGTDHSVCLNNKCSDGRLYSSCGRDKDCQNGKCIHGICSDSNGNRSQACNERHRCEHPLHTCWYGYCTAVRNLKTGHYRTNRPFTEEEIKILRQSESETLAEQRRNDKQAREQFMIELWDKHMNFYLPNWQYLPYTTRLVHYGRMFDYYEKFYIPPIAKYDFIRNNPLSLYTDSDQREFSVDTWDISTGISGIRN